MKRLETMVVESSKFDLLLELFLRANFLNWIQRYLLFNVLRLIMCLISSIGKVDPWCFLITVIICIWY